MSDSRVIVVMHIIIIMIIIKKGEEIASNSSLALKQKCLLNKSHKLTGWYVDGQPIDDE